MGRKKPLTEISKTMHFHIISLFPESFTSYIESSILSRSIQEGVVSVSFYNPRDFVDPKGAQKTKEKPLRVVDDRPYGGGPGMVIKAMPVISAIQSALKKIGVSKKRKTLIVFMSPGGKQFTTEVAAQYTKEYTDIICICGRYEGVDARVLEVFTTEQISIGPWVVTGGELPALVMMDVIARQIPGVLGNFDSREESRISSHIVYTRPEAFTYKKKKYEVPKILLSGDHKEIEKWRAEQGQ